MATLATDLAVALVFVFMLAACAFVEALLHLFTPCRDSACMRCGWARVRGGR